MFFSKIKVDIKIQDGCHKCTHMASFQIRYDDQAAPPLAMEHVHRGESLGRSSWNQGSISLFDGQREGRLGDGTT